MSSRSARLYFTLCLLLGGCTGLMAEDDGPHAPGGTGTEAQGPEEVGFNVDLARDMLEEHNSVRANASPTPVPPLPPLTWSTTLAQAAQAWADRCVPEHDENNTTGENLAFASAGRWSAAEVVRDWASEAADYDLSSNTCAADKMCGHYTQIVWRATTEVGCGFRRCTTGSPFERFPTWDFWVCRYSPAGNVTGQRPY